MSLLIGVSSGTIGKDIKGFKKVLKLHGDGIPAENIACELEMSKSLVRQYLEIIVDQAETRKE